jgi:uncharacterized membrane protein YjjP (DUF1212 family)
VNLREPIREIARAHRAKAEIAVQVDSAVLTVYENGEMNTIVGVGSPQTRRLGRFSDMKTIVIEAKRPDANVEELSERIEAIRHSPPLNPPWLTVIGTVLFAIGFSVHVQATWSSLWLAALSATIVGLIGILADRFGGISLLTAFFSAIAVSTAVRLTVDNSHVADRGQEIHPPGTTDHLILPFPVDTVRPLTR